MKKLLKSLLKSIILVICITIGAHILVLPLIVSELMYGKTTDIFFFIQLFYILILGFTGMFYFKE